MEAPRHAKHRETRRSRRNWWILAIVALVVLIVVIVPTAVVLTDKKHQSNGLRSSVLLPLYVYPLAGAWQPLYNA
jgi:flagellar basal body-associated protein FliL